jgi:hypothetical protein
MRHAGIHWMVMCIALGAIPAWAVDVSCKEGWFGVKAQIVRIDPAGQKVFRRRGSEPDAPVGVDDTLCAGDVLRLPNEVKSIDYYEGGRTVHLTERTYTAGGTGSFGGKAGEYVKLLMGSVAVLSPPPPRPAATSSRGTVAVQAGPAQAILPLKDLPRQHIAIGLSTYVSWRDGHAPYACEVTDESADPLWKGTATEQGWCTIPVENRAAARLSVRDADRRALGWNVQVVQWTDVPRPKWIDGLAASQLPAAQTTAWALWLWREAAPEWRLQALGMLGSAAKNEWLAGYFLDGVLNESPPARAR